VRLGAVVVGEDGVVEEDLEAEAVVPWIVVLVIVVRAE
jgi:hypothetical protein